MREDFWWCDDMAPFLEHTIQNPQRKSPIERIHAFFKMSTRADQFWAALVTWLFISINMFIVFGLPVHCCKTYAFGLMASCFVVFQTVRWSSFSNICVLCEFSRIGCYWNKILHAHNYQASKLFEWLLPHVYLIIKLAFTLESKVSFIFTQTRSNLGEAKTISV